MTTPLYTAAEAQSRETFLALMWALSYPGKLHYLPEGENHFALIAETLLDLETSYYTPDIDLVAALRSTGAKAQTPSRAAYHFYAQLTDLQDLRAASIGTMLYPDEGATLIIGCTIGSGQQLVVRGPGVKDQQIVHIGGIPETFWQLRETACQFPLGWDVYFVDGQQLIGLPRSVQLELK